MRAVVQRSKVASVMVRQEVIGRIDHGLVVFLGVAADDHSKDADYLADKILGLRIFDDADGKMNLGLAEVQGDLLVVSQFTLYGDARKGKRPSFVHAAKEEQGRQLYDYFIQRVSGHGSRVATGSFGADMQVSLVNDGPVTLLLDSRKLF